MRCLAVSAIAEAKQLGKVIGWVLKNLLSRATPTLEGTLSRWSWLYLQTLVPTNPHWASVVAISGLRPFLLLYNPQGKPVPKQ
jgi:hypothetical protein